MSEPGPDYLEAIPEQVRRRNLTLPAFVFCHVGRDGGLGSLHTYTYTDPAEPDSLARSMLRDLVEDSTVVGGIAGRVPRFADAITPDDRRIFRAVSLGAAFVGLSVFDYLVIAPGGETHSIIEEHLDRELHVWSLPDEIARGGRLKFPRYVNPETGEAWSGSGGKPAWVRRALAAGIPLDAFRVGQPDE